MSHPVRLALIGAGSHSSRKLYPNLHRLQHAIAVANCDLDRDRAEAVGRRHGIAHHYDDWRAMLADSDPDGVIVCVGDRMHAELAVALMQEGRHVFVEKPHAPDLEASLAMLDTARSQARICMAGYKKRYAPAYVQAKAMAAGYDAISRLHIQRSMGGNTRRDPGYLWQWGCHAIDLVDWFLGPPQEVLTWRSGGNWAAVSTLMRFASGAVGELSLSSPGGNWEQVVVQGTDMDALRVWDGLYLDRHHGNEVSGGRRPAFCASNDADDLMGFTGELQGFVDAIRSGVRPPSNMLAASRTVALYEAMLRSLESGHPETVTTIDAELPDLTATEVTA